MLPLNSLSLCLPKTQQYKFNQKYDWRFNVFSDVPHIAFALSGYTKATSPWTTKKGRKLMACNCWALSPWWISHGSVGESIHLSGCRQFPNQKPATRWSVVYLSNHHRCPLKLLLSPVFHWNKIEAFPHLQASIMLLGSFQVISNCWLLYLKCH